MNRNKAIKPGVRAAVGQYHKKIACPKFSPTAKQIEGWCPPDV